jgi:hypothetical protein
MNKIHITKCKAYLVDDSNNRIAEFVQQDISLLACSINIYIDGLYDIPEGYNVEVTTKYIEPDDSIHCNRGYDKKIASIIPVKQAMNKLEERFQEVIGESDLHIPPWISKHPEIDYPIEEAHVVERCAAITKEIAIGFANFVGNRPLPEYSESLNLWRWWDNDSRKYKTATTEQLFEMYLNTLK